MVGAAQSLLPRRGAVDVGEELTGAFPDVVQQASQPRHLRPTELRCEGARPCGDGPKVLWKLLPFLDWAARQRMGVFVLVHYWQLPNLPILHARSSCRRR